MRKWIKSLNWGAFVIILVGSVIAALANRNEPFATNLKSAIYLGLIFGTIFGLIIAIITRDEN